MTQAPNVVIPSRTDGEDLSIVLWVIQSTMCTTTSLCEVLRFAQDDRFENE
jgi:hypothetical protein